MIRKYICQYSVIMNTFFNFKLYVNKLLNNELGISKQTVDILHPGSAESDAPPYGTLKKRNKRSIKLWEIIKNN